MLKQAADSGLTEVSTGGGGGGGGVYSQWGMQSLEVTKMPISFLPDRPKRSLGCFSPRSHTWMSREP